MFSRCAELYDAFYSWKAHAAEADSLDALVEGAPALLEIARRRLPGSE